MMILTPIEFFAGLHKLLGLRGLAKNSIGVKSAFQEIQSLRIGADPARGGRADVRAGDIAAAQQLPRNGHGLDDRRASR